MSLLQEIDPLKQAALAELKGAADLAALEQAKGAWIGPHGKFTALMKQLGTLPREEKPAAGKAVNAAKVELESRADFTRFIADEQKQWWPVVKAFNAAQK